MKLKIAQLDDIDSILKLHFRYQVDSIEQEDKKDGFVTIAFTHEQLSNLITKEQGLFIAIEGNEVVGYAMSASWEFWTIWPMFVQMVKDLDDLEYLGKKLSVENSYQYGPVCIDKKFRGSGLLEKLFDFAREHMSKKYPILVTFVNKINHRSFVAHTKKLGLTVIKEFEFNGNSYYELVYDTSKPIK